VLLPLSIRRELALENSHLITTIAASADATTMEEELDKPAP
jgi:hypothetical protein